MFISSHEINFPSNCNRHTVCRGSGVLYIRWSLHAFYFALLCRILERDVDLCMNGDVSAVDVLLLRAMTGAASSVGVATPILGGIPEPAEYAVITDQVARQLH